MKRSLLLALTLISAIDCYCQVQYFPNLSLDKDQYSHTILARWYSGELTAMEEPSLLTSADTFRFTWLRSFNDPIAIRLELKSDKSGELHVKIRHRTAKKRPSATEFKTINIPVTDVSTFLKLIAEAQFWASQENSDQRGKDGSEWILEGVEQGKYNVVHRWSPEKGSVREIGLLLIKMADLKLTKGEIY